MHDETVRIDRADPVFAYLIVLQGDRVGVAHQLRRGATNIGRAMDCHVLLRDSGASDTHARIKFEDGGEFVLYDLASTNGTTVGGAAINRHPLKDNDVIAIGSTTFVFKQL